MSAASDEVPDAPSALRLILPTEPTAKLSHKPSRGRFMHGETDRLTSREVFDRRFWIAHGIFQDSIIHDAELTHQGLAHHRCVEGHMNLGSIHRARRSIVIILLEQFLSLTFMDWALGKYVWKGLGYEGATVGSVIHFRAEQRVDLGLLVLPASSPRDRTCILLGRRLQKL
jgi:hypothetical protein